MLSHENLVSIAFAVLGMILGLAVDFLTNQPDWVALVVVVLVGLVAPRLYLRLQGDAE